VGYTQTYDRKGKGPRVEVVTSRRRSPSMI
jgi:hypothetical protein